MKLVDSGAMVEPGAIKTSSRWKMWWLTNVKRYSIVSVVTHPKKYSMGRLVYEKTWILKKSE